VTRIRSLILNDSDVRSVLDGTKRMHAVAVRREKAPSPGYGAAPYQVGDMVWVRETHWLGRDHAPDSYPEIHYRADKSTSDHDGYRVCPTPNTWKSEHDGPWTPAPRMSKWMSRLTLRVTDVSVERDEGGQWTWMVAFERVGDTKVEGGRGLDREGGTEP
jgi:hypothetical protein